MDTKKQNVPVKSGGVIQSSSAKPMTATPQSSDRALRSLADALFDWQNSEKDHARDAIPAALLQSIRKMKRQDNQFLGLLGPCIVDGCDVHFLDANLEIIEHVGDGRRLEPPFERARKHWEVKSDSDLAALVFLDHYEVLRLDGSVKTKR